ncbi:hypothetical protein HanIR_Chr14g0678231 [Helianthus annuus]|nr:hypothetical protein HanIR_Chr14g0678231 [Helianthus annuus]
MTQSGPVLDRSTWEGQSCISGAVIVVRYLGIGKLAIWECWSGHGTRLLN